MLAIDLTNHSEDEAWLALYEILMRDGKPTSPRGLQTLEIQDAMIAMDTFNRFPTFAERKFSHRYVYAEFLWYLRGSTDDLTIARYAPFWKSILDDPSRPFLWSQYGRHAWRQGQLERCVYQLTDDPSTRKASIVLASRENYDLPVTTKDTVCTYAVNFAIRNWKLEMRVSMRSNDFVRGLQSDFFQFSMWHEIVWQALREKYPRLEIGQYVHKADSLHVYERHWSMARSIIESFGSNYVPTSGKDMIPKISGPEEAWSIIKTRHFSSSPAVLFCKKFTDWDKEDTYKESA